MAQALRNPAVWEWLSVIPQPYTREHALTFITEIGANTDWVITKDDAPVGVIGLTDELGYWLAEPFWGQGIITEAAQTVLDWAFAVEGRDAVASGHFNDNLRSKNALEKLGFVDDGPQVLGCLSDGRTDIPSRKMTLTRACWRTRHLAQSVRAQSVITTERLVLRPLCAADFDALHDMVSRWEVTRQLGSWPWPADPVFTLSRCRPFAGEGDVRAITLDGKVIGTIGVNVGGEGKPGIGYNLHPDFHGQGFMTEAARASITYGFDTYGWPSLYAETWEDNDPSGAVLRKMGFVQTGQGAQRSKARGEMTGLKTYELSQERWRAQHPRG